MITVTLNQSTLDQLQQANSVVELRDEKGAVVGFFAPVGLNRVPSPPPTGASSVRKPRTPAEEAEYWAEVQRRAQSPGPDVTFREAFENLLARATDPAERALLEQSIDRFAESEG
jgi:hypothetical protein